MDIPQDLIQKLQDKRQIGFTRKELEACGFKWPPKKGWRKQVLVNLGLRDPVVKPVRNKGNNGHNGQPLCECGKFRKKNQTHCKVCLRRAAKKQKKLIKTAKARHNETYGGDVTGDAFLKSFQWRRVRMIALKRDGARCMCCGGTPSEGLKMHVDHIKPRRTHPELALEPSNLQVLCEVCNHGKGNWDDTDWRQINPPPIEDPIENQFGAFIASEKQQIPLP